jgi:uncharacterized membrane protein YkoI
MKVIREMSRGLTLIAVASFAAQLSFAQATQETERKVTMKDLPAPVRATVKELSKGGLLRGLSEEVENGKTFYEAGLKVNGRNKDVLIDPAGKVVEVEEQTPLASLPPEVKTAIVKQAGKGRITMVESVSKENSIVAYEAHVNTAGKKSEIKVDPGGKLIQE